MSRSTKYPAYIMTPQIDKGKAHRQVRKRVKQLITVMDINDPPIGIEADTRDLGLEEWGTRLGFDTSGILDDEFDKETRLEFAMK